MRIVWRLLWLAMTALVVLIAAALVAVRYVDLGPYRDRITAPLSELTGRQVRIDGPIYFEPGLPTRLVVEKVSFANPDWSARPAMATAQRVSATLRIRPLLNGEIDLAGVIIEKLDLSIERSETGAGNWAIARGTRGGDESKAGKSESLPSIEHVGLRDSRLTYSAHPSSSPRSFYVERLDLRSSGVESPIQLELVADFLGVHLAADGQASPLQAWVADASPFIDAQMKLSAGEAQVAELENARWLKGATLTTRARMSASEIALSEIDARNGANDVRGKVTVFWRQKPLRISGELTSERIDLRELFPMSTEGEQKDDAKQRAAGNAPREIPWHVLRLANADLSVSTAALGLHTGGELKDVVAQVKLEAGVLDVSYDLAHADVEDVKSVFHADAESEAIELELSASKVSVDDLFGTDRVHATANATVHLLANGGTRADVVRTLRGTVLIEVGSGTISGRALDIIGSDVLGEVLDLINPMAGKSGPTRLDCAVINARIRDGVAELDRGFGMETEKVSIIGAGTIDHRNGALDLAFRTEPRGMTGVSVSTVLDSLIRIRGTISDPKIRVDPMGTVGAAVHVGTAVMTGGMSLLGKVLLQKPGGHLQACRIAKGLVKDRELNPVGAVLEATETVGRALGKGLSAAGKSAAAAGRAVGGETKAVGRATEKAASETEAAGKVVGVQTEAAGKAVGKEAEDAGRAVGGGAAAAGKAVGKEADAAVRGVEKLIHR